MEIRKAQSKDMQNIINLHTSSWRENYVDALSPVFLENEIEENRQQVWQQRFNEPQDNQAIFVAEEQGKFYGFVCIYGAFDTEHGTIIDNLHVITHAKGKGIGSLLLKRGAHWADENYRDLGLYLEVLKVNVKAEGFYKSKGAKKIGEKKWNTPCGNEVAEHLYGWSSPDAYLTINQHQQGVEKVLLRELKNK